jgi:hypothetical protein
VRGGIVAEVHDNKNTFRRTMPEDGKGALQMMCLQRADVF